MLGELEVVSGKLDKEAIVRRYAAEDPAIRDLLNRALSPYVTYGVATLPEASAGSEVGNAALAERRTTLALALLDRLASRSLTGNDARNTIRMLLEVLPSRDPQPVSEREAFKRILLKDLRCGVSESTVNKAVKGCVPVFSCQLAPSEMPDIDALEYPVAVEPKYDGVRTFAIKRSGIVTLLSRNGLPFYNFGEVEAYLSEAMPDNWVEDGEVLHRTLLGKNGYKSVMNRVKAEPGKNVENNPIRYQVFDGMPLSEWDAQNCPVPYTERRARLEAVVTSMPPAPGLFGIAPTHIVRSARELEAIYLDYVQQGFEGVIIKSLDGPYSFKRNKIWMKLKPFDTIDLEVVGMVEGTGKYAGMMGALVCRGEHDGKAIETEVGTGFTDDMRTDPGWVGRIIEVRYQDITQAEGSATWSLRFPSFVRIRETDGSNRKL